MNEKECFSDYIYSERHRTHSLGIRKLSATHVNRIYKIMSFEDITPALETILKNGSFLLYQDYKNVHNIKQNPLGKHSGTLKRISQNKRGKIIFLLLKKYQFENQ